MAVLNRVNMQKVRRKQFKWAQEHKKELIESKQISHEEHKKRLEKLKEMGLIKENGKTNI
jgi:hypothetical protein